MKTVIEMAREAGFTQPEGETWYEAFPQCIEAFAELVRADEREAQQAEHEADKVIIEYHEATIKRLEAAIRAEREACAKVCEDHFSSDGDWCAKAIRNRSTA